MNNHDDVLRKDLNELAERAFLKFKHYIPVSEAAYLSFIELIIVLSDIWPQILKGIPTVEKFFREVNGSTRPGKFISSTVSWNITM